jgi:hypothetical protein
MGKFTDGLTPMTKAFLIGVIIGSVYGVFFAVLQGGPGYGIDS